MSRSVRKKRKSKAQRPPVQKRLTTAQRWKWSALCAFLFGVMAFPYVMRLIRHPDPVRWVVLVLIAGIGVVVFVSMLKEH